VSIHGGKRGKPFSINSENRDIPVAERIRAAADRLDRVLREADDEQLDRLTRHPHIGRKRGPHHLNAIRPTAAAIVLATRLAEQTITPLTAALRGRDHPLVIGNGWHIGEPVMDIGVGADFGIPLLGACSVEAMIAFSRMRIATEHESFEQVKDDLSIRLTGLIAAEHVLWDLASKHGGPSPTLPYAYRYRALEWLWAPNASRRGDGVGLCLRCGTTIRRKLAPRVDPRCPHCAKESRTARVWPDHAIAPAEQGTWWLRCNTAGCSNAFVSSAQARRCPYCKTARITPVRRRSWERPE
jgi:hypothetical protein